ncbi:hypothetical protein HPB52_023772 [Rhipicephalus sanguineus]|uniref:Uncharacterized protein n=1 Tax=Rhipicephalus sanguineus TaxID=34632 RepID=A0A9D4T102_RHISA|nr:hypothetical protein HPB52_023772 [Rhipicephalus sanguineus]
MLRQRLGLAAYTLLWRVCAANKESSPSSTNAVSPEGFSSPDLNDVSGASPASVSFPDGDLSPNLSNENSREGLNLSVRPNPSTGNNTGRHIPATQSEDDDAASSVSQTTAVPVLRTDLGTRVQTRAREIEEELSRCCVETDNRIPVNSLSSFNCALIYELMLLQSAAQLPLCRDNSWRPGERRRTYTGAWHWPRRGSQPRRYPEADFPSEAASSYQKRPGVAVGLHGDLLSGVPARPARSYAAALQAGVPPPPGLDALPARQAPALHEHAAFVTPITPSATPARDSLRILKANSGS